MELEKDPKNWVKVQCNNKRCIEMNRGVPYEWYYRGKAALYTSCPRCKGSININRFKKKLINENRSE